MSKKQKRIKLKHGSARVGENVTKETVKALNSLSERAYNQSLTHKIMEPDRCILDPHLIIQSDGSMKCEVCGITVERGMVNIAYHSSTCWNKGFVEALKKLKTKP